MIGEIHPCCVKEETQHGEDDGESAGDANPLEDEQTSQPDEKKRHDRREVTSLHALDGFESHWIAGDVEHVQTGHIPADLVGQGDPVQAGAEVDVRHQDLARGAAGAEGRKQAERGVGIGGVRDGQASALRSAGAPVARGVDFAVALSPADPVFSGLFD